MHVQPAHAKPHGQEFFSERSSLSPQRNVILYGNLSIYTKLVFPFWCISQLPNQKLYCIFRR